MSTLPMLRPTHVRLSRFAGPTAASRPSGARFAAVGVLVALMALVYATLLLTSPARAEDFRTFDAAAQVLHHGGNPYDIGQLLAMERRLFAMNAEQRAWATHNPYVQGILPLALLGLLSPLPWPVAFAAWSGLLLLCVAGATVALSRLWPIAQRPSRTFLLAASPVVFVGLLLGQADAAILLAQCACYLFLARRPALAGLALTVGLFKPQIVAGTLLVAAFVCWRERTLRRYLLGLTGGLVATAAVTLLCGSPALLFDWAGGLLGFGRDVMGVQVNISSLTALGSLWWPHALMPVALLLCVLWCGGMFVLFRRADDPRQRWALVALGQVLWLLATPYAHPHDDILLLPVLWWLWHERRALSWGMMPAWVLFWVTWWMFPIPFLRPLFLLFPAVPPQFSFGLVPVLILCLIVVRVVLRRNGAEVSDEMAA